MRSAILMGSAAMLAMLATPAFALPDRYEQGYSCTGRGVMCTQQQFREDGNRFDDKERTASSASDGGGFGVQSGFGEARASAARNADDDDEVGDEIGATADEAGDEIENAADEAGDALDEAGDEIGDAFD